jgi:hypothetical protein
MKIEIRRNGVPVAIVTFHTHCDRFDSEYDRNKFFRELHGWKQTVPRNGKKYLYHRPGLLDEVPHVKVADSAFIVAMENMQRVIDHFDAWAEKVEYEMIEAMMNDGEIIKQLLQRNNAFES